MTDKDFRTGTTSRPQRRQQLWRSTLLCAVSLLWGTGAWAQAPTPSPVDQAPELRFQDFYQRPISPKGAQFTDTLQQANGRTVRITGYMVQNERPNLGRFMLTPRPVRMSEHADGDADDLPLSWVMVYLDPSQKEFAIPYVRGLIELTGTLQTGRMEEADGRVSWVRLQLSQDATRGMNAFELARYLHSLQHTH
jgi:hypothetical protein